MKIILTGSLGHISSPLTKKLVKQGNAVTVISSKTERAKEIQDLGAAAAIGSIWDVEFLTRTFLEADIVYLMEPPEPDRLFDPNYDPYQRVSELVNIYKKAVQGAGVKKVVHLSSIGAHTNQGVGLLRFHYEAEEILRSLPADVAIKFMRPVGFYYNLLRDIDTIKTVSTGFVGALLALQYYGIRGLFGGKRGLFMANYGGATVNLLVAPEDIASVIAEEMSQPFAGRMFRYIASEEKTCNEVAQLMGNAIGKPYLKWGKISDKMLKKTLLKAGLNPLFADGLVEMGAAGQSGKLYEDYYQHRPVLGPTKLDTFAPVFAAAYQKS